MREEPADSLSQSDDWVGKAREERKMKGWRACRDLNEPLGHLAASVEAWNTMRVRSDESARTRGGRC